MVDGRISDPASGSNGKVATGHTASLAPHRSQHPPQQRMVSNSPDALPNHHDLDDEECGSEESEVRALRLIVTQPASIPSAAAGLAPEAPEGIIVGQQHPRMSTTMGSNGVFNTEEDESPPADLDVEVAPLLGTTKDERQYLSKTNPRLFMLIFLSILLAMFIAIFDGTIMASSHPV